VNTPISGKTNNLPNWRALFNLTILSAYFYAAMEWVFFATKPSSLSVLSAFDLAKVLFVTGGIVALISLAALVLLSLPALLIRNPTWRSRLSFIGYIVPALILSITALIMLDNFTYTVFKYGIVLTEGFFRGLYALGFLLFLWLMFRSARRSEWARRKFVLYLSLGLLAVSTLSILTTMLSTDRSSNRLDTGSLSSSSGSPNIIILGSDGLSASYMSVYGADYKTTPFLNDIAQTSLVAENAFPNASSTTGSTTSVLTGKAPILDKVFRYPDILSGRDSFEHLPGILRQRGYQTVEIGTPFYVDARKLNLLEGFDVVNNHSLNEPAARALRMLLGNSASTYFIQTIVERAGERLLHIFFIREMPNPLKEVLKPAARLSDEQRVDQILEQLDQADRPVFIFAHLMDTHGPEFSFQNQIFSSGPGDEKGWDKGRYRDAILSFDGHVRRIYEHLAETGQLDRTILVIYTDHGFKYAIRERVPLLIHFPGNAHAGLRQNNVQNMDIPVTLLDYLGIHRPDWMRGISLLRGELPAEREIISTTSGSPKEIAPPFNQINVVQIIVCHKWYALNVRKNLFDSGPVAGHTAKCDEYLLPPDEFMHRQILEYLADHGYDTSSLQ
jgi:arylsulfatase A-like enzyme